MKIFIKGQEIALKNDLSTVYKYKGSLPDEASLPTENNAVGDVYNCEDTGNNFAWEGTKWDKLAGTVDMSNYYTKAQASANARSIANEAISNIPISDLLHYKGHVDGVDGLPSLGQPTGIVYPEGITINSRFNDSSIPLGNTSDLVTTLPYYLCSTHYSSATVSAYRVYIETEYPDMVHAVVSYIQRGSDNTSNRYRGYLGYYIEHNPDKPVYFRYVGAHTNFPYTIYTNPNGVWKRTTSAYATIGRSIVNAETDYIFMPCGYGNVMGSDYGGSLVYDKDLFLISNFPSLNYKYIDLGLAGDALCKSVKLYNETYYYNDGMKFLEPDENGEMYFVKNITNTKFNDVYTVGDNYDIYRRNALPAWERWSQGVSKDYVDSIVGGVNTELETIINGEE